MVLVSAGANDIYSNSYKGSEVICKMTQFVQNYNNTNIAIVGIPHRHDLDKDSQINITIRELDNKLKEKGKLFNHVSFIETDRQRKNYTKQGFHLNKSEKEGLARQMAKQIIDFTKTEYKDIPVIALAWKDNTGIDTPLQLTADHIMHSIDEGNDKIANRCSTRQKKNPFQ